MVMQKNQFAASLLGIAIMSGVISAFTTHMLENAAGQEIRGFAIGVVASQSDMLEGITGNVKYANEMIDTLKLKSDDLKSFGYNPERLMRQGIVLYDLRSK